MGEAYSTHKLSLNSTHDPLILMGNHILGSYFKLKDDLSSVQERLTSMKDFNQQVSREKGLLEFCSYAQTQ